MRVSPDHAEVDTISRDIAKDMISTVIMTVAARIGQMIGRLERQCMTSEGESSGCGEQKEETQGTAPVRCARGVSHCCSSGTLSPNPWRGVQSKSALPGLASPVPASDEVVRVAAM